MFKVFFLGLGEISVILFASFFCSGTSQNFHCCLLPHLKMGAIDLLLQGLQRPLAALSCGFLLGLMGVANVFPTERRRQSIASIFKWRLEILRCAPSFVLLQIPIFFPAFAQFINS